MSDKKQPERHWTPPETGSFVDRTSELWNSKGFDNGPQPTEQNPVAGRKKMAGTP